MKRNWLAIWISLFAAVTASAGLAQVAQPTQPPAGAASPPPQVAPEPVPPAAALDEYVVQKGDTLASIAERLTGSEDNWVELARANGIEDPDKLEVGQRLAIPPELKST